MDEKLFELFCIANDFPKYFAKCRNLSFVSHIMIIFRNDQAKISGLEDILEIGKMSLYVLDCDIKASSQKTFIKNTAALLKSHFVIKIFPEVP